MPERSIYELALRILEHRPRSVAELRRKLLQKGGSPEAVDETIAQLIDQRLLDDEQFARQFARSRITGPGTSRFRLVQELARKGVGRSVAENAIAALQEDEDLDPSSSIHRVAEKKLRTMASLDPATRRRRLYAFLARRGFNPGEIRAALDRLAENP